MWRGERGRGECGYGCVCVGVGVGVIAWIRNSVLGQPCLLPQSMPLYMCGGGRGGGGVWVWMCVWV